jgi:hypothetical protein
MEALKMFTIFNSPADFPGLFVARAFYIAAGEVHMGEVTATGKSLDEVRYKLPAGLYRIERAETDHANIIESWV